MPEIKRDADIDATHDEALRMEKWLAEQVRARPYIIIIRGTSPCPSLIGHCENRTTMS
jgi:hypothetical protein